MSPLLTRLIESYKRYKGVDEASKWRAILEQRARRTMRETMDSGWWEGASRAELHYEAVQMWQESWEGVTSVGRFLASEKAEEIAACKQRLSTAVVASHPSDAATYCHAAALVEVYRHYASAVEEEEQTESNAEAGGRNVSVLSSMKRTGWRCFCRRLAVPALNEVASSLIFDEITHMRTRALRDQLRDLRRGDHLLRERRTNGGAAASDEAAKKTIGKKTCAEHVAESLRILKRTNERLVASELHPGLGFPEFVEAVVCAACLVHKYERDPIARARRAFGAAFGASVQDEAAMELENFGLDAMSTNDMLIAVLLFIGDHVRPHAVSSVVGWTADLRQGLGTSGPLRRSMIELMPFHAELYARFAISFQRGRRTRGEVSNWAETGVDLSGFLSLGEQVAPSVPRELVVRTFATCLSAQSFLADGAEALLTGSTRTRAADMIGQRVEKRKHQHDHQLLSPVAFQEGVVRLALLMLTIDSDHRKRERAEDNPRTSLSSVSPWELEGRLDAVTPSSLRAALHRMRQHVHGTAIHEQPTIMTRWVFLPEGSVAMLHSDVQRTAALRLQRCVRRQQEAQRLSLQASEAEEEKEDEEEKAEEGKAEEGKAEEGKAEARAADETVHAVSRIQTSLRARLAASHGKILDLFRSMDTNEDQMVSKEELSTAMSRLGIHAPPTELDGLFNSFDLTRDGSIAYKELSRALRRETETELRLREELATPQEARACEETAAHMQSHPRGRLRSRQQLSASRSPSAAPAPTASASEV